MLNFTAIDFETANSFRGSPCSVGLVRVRDGQTVERLHLLIRPPEAADWFDPWNTSIHGITSEMVADAPRWRHVLPNIIDFVSGDIVVAHNASFDLGVIRYACAIDDLAWPSMRFLCTLVMARRVLELPSYRLPFVTEALGFHLNNHHDALEDADAAAVIASELAARQGAHDLPGLAESIGVRIGYLSSDSYQSSTARPTGPHGRNFTPVEINEDADPSGHLYGRVVVFTGALKSMTRDVARQECAKVGGIPELNTTKRTNILVVGDINPAVLRPGSHLTGKARKAFELQDTGQDIEVMTEDDFLRCLEGNQLAGAEVLLTPSHGAQVTDKSETPASTRSRPSTPLGDRVPAKPEATKPPKPLHRTPVPTDQLCSTAGCGRVAAFKTRSKPTWCTTHIEEIQRTGGLHPLEPFTHPDDWQLMECLHCGVAAHYRFNYTLEKNQISEPTCRACFWRRWAAEARRLHAPQAAPIVVPYSEAEAIADKHGYEYLGPLSAPSYRGDPHHVRCRRCGKVSAQRLADISFGCTCLRHT